METPVAMEPLTEFDQIYKTPAFCDAVRKKATAGELKGSSIRSVHWRVLLECLPKDRSKWAEEVRRQRQKYNELHEKLWIDPHKVEGDPTVNNPLCPDEEVIFYVWVYMVGALYA
eukprot:Colp12_sorted_trinity150504_noHs@32540